MCFVRKMLIFVEKVEMKKIDNAVVGNYFCRGI